MNDTSESRYGIPAQPKPTCPIIDQGLKLLGDIETFRVDRYLQRRIDNADTVEELRDVVDDIVYLAEEAADIDVSKIESAFEGARQQAIDIREWGDAWKELAKEAMLKVESAKTLTGALSLWWSERDQDWVTRKLRIFYFDRNRKEPYRVAI